MTAPLTGRVAQANVWIDTTVLAGRSLRLMLRSPSTLTVAAMFPVILLLVMSVSLGKVVLPGASFAEYVDYALPVFITMGVTFAGLATAMAVVVDRETGFDHRLRTLPVAPVATVAGRILADSVRNFTTVMVVLGVGVALGFRFDEGYLGAVGFVVVPVAYGIGLTWLMVAVAMYAGSAEAASAVMSTIMLVLSFLSTGMVRLQDLPDWARPVAEANPISRVCQSMRALAHGGPAAADVVAVTMWALGLSLVFGWIAVRGYARRG